MSLSSQPPRLTRSLVVVLLAATLASGLSACGRRGALELPPNIQGPSQKTGGQGQPDQDKAPAAPKRGPVISNKPFILDPIL